MTAIEILGIASPIIAILGFIGAIIANDRAMNNRIQAAKDSAIQASHLEIAQLHGTFAAEREKNDARALALHDRIDDIKDNFVRRDDFQIAMGTINKNLEGITASQGKLQSQLTQVLIKLGP